MENIVCSSSVGSGYCVGFVNVLTVTYLFESVSLCVESKVPMTIVQTL